MDAPLDSFRPSTLGWLIGTITGWGIILLGLAGILLAVMNVAEFGIWWLILTAAALAITGWRWFENLAAKYEFTEERLIIRRGIFIKSIDEIEHYRIKDVRIDFSLINQMADIGMISISSSDETTRKGDLELRDIKHARARREALRRLVDTARQKRRVREIDMVHEDI